MKVSHTIEIGAPLSEVFKEFTDLESFQRRDNRSKSLMNEINSAREQGMLVETIDRILKVANQGRIEKVFIPNEKLGPGYRKEKHFSHPVEGTEKGFLV